jgi:hypothetical protein
LFSRTIAYRDKKVVGVFVRFSCAAENNAVNSTKPRLICIQLLPFRVGICLTKHCTRRLMSSC